MVLVAERTTCTADGVNNFGLDAIKKAISVGKNAIFASTSVVSVLAMTLLGAKGKTALQLKTSLSHNKEENSEVDPMTGLLDSNMEEDEVDGMVNPPSTSMDIDSIASSSKGSCSPPQLKKSRLKKMKEKFRSLKSDDVKDWALEDQDFHAKLGEIITFDAAMSHKKQQAPAQGYILKSANRIYLKKNGHVLKGFLQASEKMYHSKPEVMDFAAGPEKCRQEINHWVEKQTHGRIKDLIAPGTVSIETSILIVNAIYFKGTWADKFDTSLTRKSLFNPLQGEAVETDFMFKRDDLLYKDAHEIDSQVVELPYEGGDVSFFVIVPNQATGLLELEKQLSAATLADVTSDMCEREVILHLPKFKIEVSLELAEVLQLMGIKDLFDPNTADLSGIDPKGNLYVSNIVHKAFIEVNEEGSEAAGATAEILMAAGAPTRRTVVKADHPFVFLIKDNRSGVTLFLGKFCEP